MRTLSIGMGSVIVGVAGLILGVVVTLNAQSTLDQAHEQLTIATQKQDTTAFANVVTDDLIIVRSDGRVQSSSQRIEEIKQGIGLGGGADFAALKARQDYRVRTYGDAAIVTWLNPDPVAPNGVRFVRVFVRQGGTWKMAHSQQTRIQ